MNPGLIYQHSGLHETPHIPMWNVQLTGQGFFSGTNRLEPPPPFQYFREGKTRARKKIHEEHLCMAGWAQAQWTGTPGLRQWLLCQNLKKLMKHHCVPKPSWSSWKFPPEFHSQEPLVPLKLPKKTKWHQWLAEIYTKFGSFAPRLFQCFTVKNPILHNVCVAIKLAAPFTTTLFGWIGGTEMSIEIRSFSKNSWRNCTSRGSLPLICGHAENTHHSCWFIFSFIHSFNQLFIQIYIFIYNIIYNILYIIYIT